MRRKKKKQKEAEPITITGYSPLFSIVPADYVRPAFWLDYFYNFENFADNTLDKMKDLDEFVDEYMDALINTKFEEVLDEAADQHSEHLRSIDRILRAKDSKLAICLRKKAEVENAIEEATRDENRWAAFFEKYNYEKVDRRIFDEENGGV